MKYKYYYSVNGKKYKKMTRTAANKSVYHCRVFSLAYVDEKGKKRIFCSGSNQTRFGYLNLSYTRERRPYTFGKLCKFFDKGAASIPRLREYTAK
jgi:hypothetical protein